MFKILILSLALPVFSAMSVIPNQKQLNAKGTLLGNLRGSDWFNLGPADDAQGSSVNLTYQDFGNPTNEVIVAVIDSGVDVNHEDLKGKIWVNKSEIPNDGIDNDGNGYIDDVYGWNFLGSEKGMGEVLSDGTFMKGDRSMQANDEPLEFAREINRLQSLNRELSTSEKRYFQALKDYEREAYCGEPHYCDPEFKTDVRKLIDAEMIDGVYGNNDIIGPDSSHGTHVAGIIAANRFNNLGIKGIASNAKIMALRAVPNGDEYDTDIANAVIYAVNNGAKIINMSFGKSFSPKKSLVDRAMMYAEQNGVLLVHAAGNSSKEVTVNNNFPNKAYMNSFFMSNSWIEVGASSKNLGSSLSAYFSNYSPTLVNLFAPGVDINSTTPSNDYNSYSGTSMASPVTAGVAALVLGYDNSLSGQDLKVLLESSVKKYGEDVIVQAPKYGPFRNLSITGGILDAHNAMTLLNQ